MIQLLIDLQSHEWILWRAGNDALLYCVTKCLNRRALKLFHCKIRLAQSQDLQVRHMFRHFCAPRLCEAEFLNCQASTNSVQSLNQCLNAAEQPCSEG